jgi:hypothetical protein
MLCFGMSFVKEDRPVIEKTAEMAVNRLNRARELSSRKKELRLFTDQVLSNPNLVLLRDRPSFQAFLAKLPADSN